MDAREQGINSFRNPVGQVPDLPSTKPVATAATPAVSKNIPRNALALAAPEQNTKNAEGLNPRPYKADSKSMRHWAVSPVWNAIAKRSIRPTPVNFLLPGSLQP
jgi:hypothetical protein